MVSGTLKDWHVSVCSHASVFCKRTCSPLKQKNKDICSTFFSRSMKNVTRIISTERKCLALVMKFQSGFVACISIILGY